MAKKWQFAKQCEAIHEVVVKGFPCRKKSSKLQDTARKKTLVRGQVYCIGTLSQMFFFENFVELFLKDNFFGAP